MATLTEDDVLEQLDAQDNLFSFMKTAHSILLQGIRQFLPSLFVDNDEEIVEYAVSRYSPKAARLTILMLHCV